MLCALIGAAAVATGVRYTTWWLIALGAAVILGSLPPIRIIRQGRNPKWLQAPLDRR